MGPVRLRAGRQPHLRSDARGGSARGGRQRRGGARGPDRATSSTRSTRPAGLHHAMPARASGFCVYDDPAVAIAWMLPQGADRVAYVDVDVHHGDGVQAIFYDDPRVLTISIHEFAPLGSSPEPARPTNVAVRTRPGSPSTCRCHPSRTTTGGWTRSATSCRRRSRRSPPTCWSPSWAATRTRPIRSRSCSSPPRRIASRSDAARARARGGRRPLGGDRRRRVPVGARRARGRGRSRSPRWPRSNSTTSLPAELGGAGDGVVGRCGPRDAVRPAPGGRPVTARTKLVCTLGPATNTPTFVRGLVAAGTSIFRINFSHGTPDDHARGGRPRPRRRGRGRPGARGHGRPPGPEGAAGDAGSRAVPARSRAGLRAASGRRRRRGGHVDDLPGSRRGPAGGRPHPAGRRGGRADRDGHRGLGGADRVRARRHRPVRPGRQRPGRAAEPAGDHRSRPRRARRALDLGVDLVAQSFVRGPDDIKRAAGADGGSGRARSWPRSRRSPRSSTSRRSST